MPEAHPTTTHTTTLSGFLRISGLSRNGAYALLRDGEVDSVITEQGRRLVLLPSWESYLQRLAAGRPREAAAKRRAIESYKVSLRRKGAISAQLAREIRSSRRRERRAHKAGAQTL
jgi:hypothetical protein